MLDFVTLTCPSCGGKLQIDNNVELFTCGYCGSEHVVNRGGVDYYPCTCDRRNTSSAKGGR